MLFVVLLQITEQIFVGSCIQTEKDVQMLSNVVVHTFAFTYNAKKIFALFRCKLIETFAAYLAILILLCFSCIYDVTYISTCIYI